jgi:hypothetical protein
VLEYVFYFETIGSTGKDGIGINAKMFKINNAQF